MKLSGYSVDQVAMLIIYFVALFEQGPALSFQVCWDFNLLAWELFQTRSQCRVLEHVMLTERLLLLLILVIKFRLNSLR